MKDYLPPEFQPIAHLITNVRRVTHNEYSSSCPQCGGNDRFRLFVIGKHGSPLAICIRNCGYVWSPSKDHKPTREEVETWRKQQIAIEQERKANAERALELLQNEKKWIEFHSNNNAYFQDYYAKRGFSQTWIDYLQFGGISDYTVKSRKDGEWEYYHSPAATIPIWGVGNVVQNIKLRVTSPRRDGDRYRNWYEAGQSYLYVPLHDLELEDCDVVLCEGEYKAGLMQQTLDGLKSDYTAVGVQSKKPSVESLEALKNCNKVFVWLDNDAFIVNDKSGLSAVQYVCRGLKEMGLKNILVVDCPTKSDDGILQGMNPLNYINMAKKV